MNLDKVQIDEESLAPIEAAEDVAVNRNEIAWFSDVLTIDASHKPRFGNAEVSV